jgi:two-component system, sensor histidine kinase
MANHINLVEEAEARVSPTELGPDPFRISSLTVPARDILVVDDVPANITAIEAALAPLGRRLVTARSGGEALARLLEEDFALILLDVQMPTMDGFETAKLIRARDRSRRIPIIFVTAHHREEDDVMRAYQLGAVDFLFKPIHAEVLRAKAQVFVELQDRNHELALKAEELRIAQIREHERSLDAQRKRLEAEALQREMEQQRRAAEELSRLNEQLAIADRRKDEFLAILAHELRNPLAPIQTSLELVRRNPDRAVPVRVLEILERQVRHVTRLVDDLLDISRITAGKIELRKEPLKLSDIIEQAVVSARPLVDAKRHTLVVRHPGDDSVVLGDPVRLVQVVSNLLNNAAKYTQPGGQIDLDWGHDEHGVYVRISDNGRGIAPELIGRVFDMFVQERAGTDGAGGLGLGLALVRRLAELHGGSVAAESGGHGKGATFEIRLPRTEATSPDKVTSRSLPLIAPQAAARPLRAVVIDDNPDLRELIADLLTSYGHVVTTADDGLAGLALIREHKPDVALVDIGLPGLDGYGLAQKVRSELPDLQVRLVAMTGYGQDHDRARALEAGFDVHIVKPATAATILQALGDDA